MRFKVLFYRSLFAIAGFLLPLGVLAGAVPYVINAEPFKQHLIKELRDWTGSHVELNGPVAIDSFGSLSLSAQDVEFYAFNAFPQIKTLRAEEIVARIAWMDLFAGRLDFDKIKITGAHVQMSAFGPRDSVAAAEALLAMSRKAQFGALIVQDSTITTEAGPNAGAPLERSLENLAISLDPSSHDIELSLAFTEKQERVAIRARVRAGALSEQGAVVPLELALESPHTAASFEGTAKIGENWRAVGKLSVTLHDPQRLGNWLDQPYLGILHLPLSVSGNAEITKQSVAFDGAEISIAGQNGTGEFDLVFGGDSRELLGSAAFAALDLTTLPQPGATGASGVAADPALLKEILANLRLDLRVSAESLKYEAMETGEVAITMLGKNGQFSTEIANMAVLGGSVFGHANIKLDGGTPLIETRLTGANLDMRRMQSFAGMPALVSGNIDGNIEASMTGGGIPEMLRNAVMSGKAAISDGGQIRLDLNRLASMPRGAEQMGWNGIDGAWSEFDGLRIAFSLEAGVVSLKQIALARPEGDVKAEGVIDMRARALDLEASFAPAGPSGAETSVSPANATILSIKGPLAAPLVRSVGNSNRAATSTRNRHSIADRTGRL
jgi:hypothetical protein